MRYAKALVSIVSVLTLVLGLASYSPASADYPVRPVKLIVPSQAGTGPDLLARLLAAHLSTGLGQPVLVENKVGANGNIAGDLVAKAPPDGYTLLVASDAMLTINPHIYARLPYQPLTDLLPVASLVSQELFLCVTPALPVKTLTEFIEFARKSPAPLSYGSASSGSQSHLAMEMLKSRAGINLLHVPYKGGAAASLAAMSGEVSAVFGGTSLKAQLASGKLKALASTGPKRSLALPDVPAVGETVSGYEALLWVGLFAPAGTQADVIASLRTAVQKFQTAADSREKLAGIGFDPYITTPERFNDLIRGDSLKYGQVVKAAGVKLD